MMRFHQPMHRRCSCFALALIVACAVGLKPAYSQELLQAEAEAFERSSTSVQDSVVQIETFFLSREGGNITSAGPTSATIIAEGGLAIASLLPFQKAPTSTLARLPDGSRKPVKILARDFSRELVLLQIEGYEGKVPPFASEETIAVGQWAIALGKTYDPQTASRSVGIVSALGRAYGRAVQTDAKISPINYGGPLVNINGEVMGILTPLSPGEFLGGDSSELYDSGIGFAVPTSQILPRLRQLAQGEDIHKGLLGVVVKDSNELVGPVELTGAAPGSPASKAGLRRGDVIVETNGQPVRRFGELKHAIASVDAGQAVEVVVERDGQRVRLQCVLAKSIPVYQKRLLGLQLLKVSDENDTASLFVTDVVEKSPAAAAGITAGSFLLRAFGEDSPSIDLLRERLSVAELDQAIELSWLTSDGQTKNGNVRPAKWETVARISPAVFDAGEATTELVELKLNDKPNLCFAVVPPLSRMNALGKPAGQAAPQAVDYKPGVLVILPSPGQEMKATALEYWSDFCVQHGWIVAVVTANDQKRWSREELEIPGRIMQRIQEKYGTDPARRAIAGIGAGGQLAFLASAEVKSLTGVGMFSASLPPFELNKTNSPGETISFFLAGPQESTNAPAISLQRAGFPVETVEAAETTKTWNDIPAAKFRAWLVSLGLI